MGFLKSILVVAGKETEASRNVVRLDTGRVIGDLYRAADAVILASHYEPFGMVAM